MSVFQNLELGRRHKGKCMVPQGHTPQSWEALGLTTDDLSEYSLVISHPLPPLKPEKLKRKSKQNTSIYINIYNHIISYIIPHSPLL